MPRHELLSLTPDDLAALSNKGKVNEARKDLDDNGVTGSLTESPDGALKVDWSDGKTSELPANATLRAGKCSCNAIGTCKHLVRLVLLYQRQTAAPPPATEPWDPGATSDNELGRHYRPAALKKLRHQFDAGVLAELVRGTRPVARFHVPVCTVRFLVPGDLRYTHCDCARPAPCDHVPLAVWAFRQLDPQRRAGTVTAGAAAPPAPADLLTALDETLVELAAQGISGAGKGWTDRLARLEEKCRSADLVWPAELLAELTHQQECYAGHDARFDPQRVADRLGELIVRLDAICSAAELPQLLIRGATGDRPIELGKGLFWGLGTGVRVGRKGVELAAYLYDTKSTSVVAITKEVADGDKDEQPRSFGILGRYVALKGTSFAAVGVGVVQIDGGRRSASHELLPGRANASVSVQDRFAWEEIGAPVYVEEFGELEDRLNGLPPSSLRPRRLAEDFHVLRVAGVQEARFDAASHSVQAVLVDQKGKRALLEHPWTSRGRAGAEALLARLSGGKGEPVFVSGQVRRSMAGLVIHPVCLVWQDGGVRAALQPWVERAAEGAVEEQAGPVAVQADDPVLEYVRRLQLALGELCVLGLSRADVQAAKLWRELAEAGEATGFARLSGRVEALARTLEERAHTVRWDVNPAANIALELAGLARLARDVAG